MALTASTDSTAARLPRHPFTPIILPSVGLAVRGLPGGHAYQKLPPEWPPNYHELPEPIGWVPLVNLQVHAWVSA